MNIFILDKNMKESVKYYVDKHVVKMPLETAQIIHSALYLNNIETGWKTKSNTDWKHTHINHPCVIWASQTRKQIYFLFKLLEQICKEYKFRYGKEHYCFTFISSMYDLISNDKLNPEKDKQFPICMPEYCKVFRECQPQLIESYRNYYMKEKRHIAKWTKRTIPKWWI